jgi:hypothetical protein
VFNLKIEGARLQTFYCRFAEYKMPLLAARISNGLFLKVLVNFKNDSNETQKRILPYCRNTFFLDIKEMRAGKFLLLSL